MAKLSKLSYFAAASLMVAGTVGVVPSVSAADCETVTDAAVITGDYTLTCDVEIEGTVTLSSAVQKITLDGYNFTAEKIVIEAGADVTFADGDYDKWGYVDAAIENNGTLLIDGGAYSGTITNNGTAKVKRGEFDEEPTALTAEDGYKIYEDEYGEGNKVWIAEEKLTAIAMDDITVAVGQKTTPEFDSFKTTPADSATGVKIDASGLDTLIATVDEETFEVTGVAKGETSVKLVSTFDETITATVKITVTGESLKTITPAETEVTLAKGEYKEIALTTDPADWEWDYADEANVQRVFTEVASAEVYGKSVYVSGYGAGNATMTLKMNGVEFTIKVTVEDALKYGNDYTENGAVSVEFETPVAKGEALVVEDAEVTDALKAQEPDLKRLFDVYVEDADGNKVAVSGNKIHVTLWLDPEEFEDYSYFQVVYVNDDGEIAEWFDVDWERSRQGLAIEFDTTHMSKYGVLASNTAFASAAEKNKAYADKKAAPDSGFVAAIADNAEESISVIVAAAVAVSVLALLAAKQMRKARA